METKFSYSAKLDILNTMSAKIAGLREDLTRLRNHEMLAADPVPGEGDTLVEFLNELEDEVDGLTMTVEPMTFFER